MSSAVVSSAVVCSAVVSSAIVSGGGADAPPSTEASLDQVGRRARGLALRHLVSTAAATIATVFRRYTCLQGRYATALYSCTCTLSPRARG